jgi:hypothetical protein
MNVRSLAFIWKRMMNPRDITTKDISNVLLDTMTTVSNIIYFKAQEIAHDHRCEKRQITKSLNEEVGLDCDKVDPKLGNLQHRRLEEDVVNGVVDS